MSKKKDGIEIRALIRGDLAEKIKREKRITDCSFSSIVKAALRERFKG